MNSLCLRCGKVTTGDYCPDHAPLTYGDRAYRQNRRLANQRDGFACVVCGSREKLGTHHIRPLADGGTHELGNLVTLCRKDHDEAEWGETVEDRPRRTSGNWR